jgi:hypothetical protein
MESASDRGRRILIERAFSGTVYLVRLFPPAAKQLLDGPHFAGFEMWEARPRAAGDLDFRWIKKKVERPQLQSKSYGVIFPICPHLEKRQMWGTPRLF